MAAPSHPSEYHPRRAACAPAPHMASNLAGDVDTFSTQRAKQSIEAEPLSEARTHIVVEEKEKVGLRARCWLLGRSKNFRASRESVFHQEIAK